MFHTVLIFLRSLRIADHSHYGGKGVYGNVPFEHWNFKRQFQTLFKRTIYMYDELSDVDRGVVSDRYAVQEQYM
jgi:hypothetical protein